MFNLLEKHIKECIVGSFALQHLHYVVFPSGSEDVFAVKACDGSALTLNCSVYENTINILHAWYHLGYSPNSCGRPDSSLSPVCSAFDAKNIVTSKCQDYRECHIFVNGSLFGHSCPGVTLQLEVFYQCTSTNLKSKFTSSCDC